MEQKRPGSEWINKRGSKNQLLMNLTQCIIDFQSNHDEILLRFDANKHLGYFTSSLSSAIRYCGFIDINNHHGVCYGSQTFYLVQTSLDFVQCSTTLPAIYLFHWSSIGPTMTVLNVFQLGTYRWGNIYRNNINSFP